MIVRPSVRLLCGDALAVLRELPSESVDLCVTSPPYGKTINYGAGAYPTGRGERPNMRARGDVGTATGAVDPACYADWFLPIASEITRVLIPGGVLALNLNGQGSYTYPEEIVARLPRETDLVLHDRGCWVKLNAIPTRSRATHTIPEWEPIYIFRRGATLAYFGRDDIRKPYALTTLRRARNGTRHSGQHGHHGTQAHPYVRGEKPEYAHPAGRDASNVIHAAPEQRPDWPHPARFPEALPEFFIAAYCPPAGLVLDPFCGVGTTPAVAARLGRNAIGIDLNAEYVAVAERRVAPYVAQGRLDLEAGS